jgi:branched-chain amino acid transport system ATP-binding protein
LSTILAVDSLGISFGNNEVLKSVSFALKKNEVLGVIGPNGAGKTVLLNILTGILKPTKGTMTLEGNDISGTDIASRCRAGIGRTFQVPRPFEQMTVFENIILGGVYGDGLSERDAKVRAKEVGQTIGLEDKMEWFAGKLGLLDRKRLEIGRALATNPKILLLDEVGGGLTESEVESIIALVKLVQSQGISVIWIEHIIKTMLEGTNRVLLLADGKNIICGDPQEVMDSKEVARVYLGGDE